MAQLRTRAVDSKAFLKTTKATIVKKSVSKKKKDIIQTFAAKDLDVNSM
jgi:hypothetical protein